jgi:hypothetical protein
LRHLHRHIATEKVDNLIKSGLVHSLCLCCMVCMYRQQRGYNYHFKLTWYMFIVKVVVKCTKYTYMENVVSKCSFKHMFFQCAFSMCVTNVVSNTQHIIIYIILYILLSYNIIFFYVMYLKKRHLLLKTTICFKKMCIIYLSAAT